MKSDVFRLRVHLRIIEVHSFDSPHGYSRLSAASYDDTAHKETRIDIRTPKFKFGTSVCVRPKNEIYVYKFYKIFSFSFFIALF